MYYNIATDLKEIFQTTKDSSENEDDLPWKEGSDGETAEAGQDPAVWTSKTEQPNGFTFSFFDSDTTDLKEGMKLFFIFLSYPAV